MKKAVDRWQIAPEAPMGTGDGVTRRDFLAGAGSLLFLATACSDGRNAAGTPERTADRPGGACGPRRVTHRYGSAEISGTPKRVVPVSFRDQDTALALGVTPIAVRDGFYAQEYTSWPWVRTELRDAEVETLPTGELSFEQIAALQPDLIAGAGSGMTEHEYRVLSKIAPTVAQSGEYVDFGAPWQEVTRTLGGALCEEDLAAERIAEVEARFAAVREEHPEIAGATGVVAMPGGPGGSYWAFGPQDSRGRFLTSLGMELPREVGALGDERFVATLSAERLHLLDADVLIWMAGPEQRAMLAAHPIYQRLAVAREGRDLFLEPDGVLTAAMTNSTVLSLPYLLAELVPRIVAALHRSSSGRADG